MTMIESYLGASHHHVTTGDGPRAVQYALAALSLAPSAVPTQLALGNALRQISDFAGARMAYVRAKSLDQRSAGAALGLAIVDALTDRPDQALEHLRVAARLGKRVDESVQLCARRHLDRSDNLGGWRLMKLAAQLRRSATNHVNDDLAVSVAKLRHDALQIEHCIEVGASRSYDRALLDLYRRSCEVAEAQVGPTGRTVLTGSLARELSSTHKRLVHVRASSRVPRALSYRWNPVAVEQRYAENSPGIVVVDDFFDPATLAELQRYVLESFVWHTDRYAHGRLGAMMHDGFGSELLIQVADELCLAFPTLIGPHPLRQLWGFKYPVMFDTDGVHADFAAVNVNLWITPTAANREPESGGMRIYDVEAPPDWDFDTYNRKNGVIRQFLTASRAREIYVPYRENRAVIFNSDLFHLTDRAIFGDRYQDRRVNITMLFGDRRRP